MQLIINAGSSTLKWALYSGPYGSRVLEGYFDHFGPQCVFYYGHRHSSAHIESVADAVTYLRSFLRENSFDVNFVIHRVVHGGEKYHAPAVITKRVIEDIRMLSHLAPLHNPANLAGIHACADIKHQVAVFDTAFHHTIHKEAFMYAIPLRLYKQFGIRKYGFHGISHANIARQLRARYKRNPAAISAHLGSGSSITALEHGHSVDTTMGFTPLDGVIMSTRSGGLDPEIPLFLQKSLNLSVEQVEDLLSHESGLMGITGSSDMREIYARARTGDSNAQLAIDMLSYRISWYMNALRTAVDPEVFVFTAGIGQRASYIRKQVCVYLRIAIDDAANNENKSQIASSPDVLVLKTDEQEEMHLQCRKK